MNLIIEKNTDGSSKLTWYIYNCKSGEKIEPIMFEANIDNETQNGVQYTTKFINFGGYRRRWNK